MFTILEEIKQMMPYAFNSQEDTWDCIQHLERNKRAYYAMGDVYKEYEEALEKYYKEKYENEGEQ